MAEQENVAVVQRFYDAVLRGDLPAILEMVAEDVVLEMPAPAAIPFSGTRRGKAGVAEYFSIVAGTVERGQDLVPEFHEFIAQGDRVVSLGRDRVRMRSTGSVSDTWWIHVFTVRDGKLTRIQQFVDTSACAQACCR